MTRKDYRLDIRVRNANILRAMKAAGIESASELAKRTGFSPSEVGLLINLRKSPRCANGDLRKSVMRICEVLNSTPQELFCDAQNEPLSTNRAWVDVAAEHAFALANRHTAIEHDDGLAPAVNAAMQTLTTREADIIRRHLGWDGEPQTLTEIGAAWDISGGRARQIAQHALRKLRHPSRCDDLREFVA